MLDIDERRSDIPELPAASPYVSQLKLLATDNGAQTLRSREIVLDEDDCDLALGLDGLASLAIQRWIGYGWYNTDERDTYRRQLDWPALRTLALGCGDGARHVAETAHAFIAALPALVDLRLWELAWHRVEIILLAQDRTPAFPRLRHLELGLIAGAPGEHADTIAESVGPATVTVTLRIAGARSNHALEYGRPLVAAWADAPERVPALRRVVIEVDAADETTEVAREEMQAQLDASRGVARGRIAVELMRVDLSALMGESSYSNY